MERVVRRCRSRMGRARLGRRRPVRVRPAAARARAARAVGRRGRARHAARARGVRARERPRRADRLRRGAGAARGAARRAGGRRDHRPARRRSTSSPRPARPSPGRARRSAGSASASRCGPASTPPDIGSAEALKRGAARPPTGRLQPRLDRRLRREDAAAARRRRCGARQGGAGRRRRVGDAAPARRNVAARARLRRDHRDRAVPRPGPEARRPLACAAAELHDLRRAAVAGRGRRPDHADAVARADPLICRARTRARCSPPPGSSRRRDRSGFPSVHFREEAPDRQACWNPGMNEPLSSQGAATETPAYLRHPTLHGDRIVFVADDDLWTVAAAGGIARRLTAGLSEPSTPCLSPDGRWLAFVGRDEQHPEVHVMPAEGGQARRLTWLGTDTHVRGWTPAGEIVYVTTQGQPFFRNHHALRRRAVGRPVARARPRARSTTSPSAPGGASRDRPQHRRPGALEALSRRPRRRDLGRRRRQRHVPPPRRSSPATSPRRCGSASRLYFLGDGEGVGNLYSCRADGSDVRRHTDHDGFYARQAQSDGQRIVYACGARLWLFDPAQRQRRASSRSRRRRTARRRRVASSRAASTSSRSSRIRRATRSRSSRAASCSRCRSGKARRRGASTTPARRAGAASPPSRRSGAAEVGADARRRGRPHAPRPVARRRQHHDRRERRVGRRAARRRSPPTRRAHPALGHRPRQRRSSPRRSGSRVAFANHRNEVWIGDVESGALQRRRLERRTAAATTSPGRPTAPGSPTPSPPTPATSRSSCTRSRRRPRTRAHRARVPRLRAVVRSRRQVPLLPVGAHLRSGLRQRPLRPQLPARRAALPDRAAGGRPAAVRSRAAQRRRGEPERKAAAGAGAADEGVAAIGRCGSTSTASLAASPPSRCARAASAASPASPARKVVWNVQNIVGAHGRGGHKEAAGKLERFDFATGRTETLAEKIDDFELAARRRYARLPRRQAPARDRRRPQARAKPEPGDDDGAAVAQERLDRPRAAAHRGRAAARVAADAARGLAPAARPVLVGRHVGRRLGGGLAPLRAAARPRRDAGRPLRPVWEMQGELGTSHAYEMGGDHRKPPGGGARLPRRCDCAGTTRAAAGRSPASSAATPGTRAPIRRSTRSASRPGRRAHRRRRRPAGLGDACRREALLVHRAGQKVQLTLASGARQRRRRCATSSSPRSPTTCRCATANGSRRTAPGCTSARTAASATSTCPT